MKNLKWVKKFSLDHILSKWYIYNNKNYFTLFLIITDNSVKNCLLDYSVVILVWPI